MQLVMASANPHKAEEMRQILAQVSPQIEVLSRPTELGEVVEDGDTLAANALIKARAVCAAAGMAAVADDTGLEVDALGGEPGVHTARFAGPGASDADNLAKLLRELRGVPAARRTARFRTVATVAFSDGRTLEAHGVAEGTIASEPTGDGGFGYDPVFVPAQQPAAVTQPRSFAQMSEAEKHAISHRGKALAELAKLLAQSPS